MAPVTELQLSVIYDPEEEGRGVAEVDLVLVHGFGGDFMGTWTDTTVKPNVFWPRELLLQKQPQTRILSFGYDAGETTTATIRDNARTMLVYLDCLRDDKTRPIVFIGQCLGGLIIRQAMCFAKRERKYRPIASATKSIMFFGTPHGGGDEKGWLKLAKNYEGFGPKCKMIDVLGKNTAELLKLDEDFCRLINDYTIVNFYELQPLSETGMTIVGKADATKLPGLEQLGVNADHLRICQFKRVSDNTFIKVCKVIKEAVGNPKEQEAASQAPPSSLVKQLPAPQSMPRQLFLELEQGNRSWNEYSSQEVPAAAKPKTRRPVIEFFRASLFYQRY
ncbi:hypothetical protein FHL15_009935 [Xylaria flabelliformis]|uniref:DUF676 domain-containing protein n=1 Tax=Xylaria flabelliformis TaxID=2512241 RepID=A0A553HMD6_9PEZI|nr:hypothetical protein FHL15_009935 [Xylaria flabelliformis]